MSQRVVEDSMIRDAYLNLGGPVLGDRQLVQLRDHIVNDELELDRLDKTFPTRFVVRGPSC